MMERSVTHSASEWALNQVSTIKSDVYRSLMSWLFPSRRQEWIVDCCRLVTDAWTSKTKTLREWRRVASVSSSRQDGEKWNERGFYEIKKPLQNLHSVIICHGLLTLGMHRSVMFLLNHSGRTEFVNMRFKRDLHLLTAHTYQTA